MMFQVVDNRDNKVLFESRLQQDCLDFLDELWEVDSTQFIYSTINAVDSESHQ